MDYQKFIITKHAKSRMKERLGLPKRGHIRHIQKVLTLGLILSLNRDEEFNLLYQGYRYIFKENEELIYILVTTFPNNYYFS